MDCPLNHPLINPPTDDNHFNDVDFSLLASGQAQHFLQQTGWAYYTIWKAHNSHHLPGLVWSRGEVNESLVASEDSLNKGCWHMGLLLQNFYKQCSFLPLSSGSIMAGEAFASRQYQWASGGEELLMQIRSLGNENQTPVPLELQALFFKTTVCIPLQNGAGVLEIGTNALVPKSDGMLFQVLKLVDGLARGSTSGGRETMSAPFEAVTKSLLPVLGEPYRDQEEQYKSASMMEMYGSRAILRHRSISSSYWSPSSTTSSSTPSTNDQKENSSNTTFLLNTPYYEDKIMSPANSLQATATSMVNSWDELHILKHLDHINMRDVSTPLSLQKLNSYLLDDPKSLAPSHDHPHLSSFPVFYAPTDAITSSLPNSLLESHRYAPAYSEGNTNNEYLFDHPLQPIQCVYSVGNEQNDSRYCYDEAVEGSSKEPNIECHTSACATISRFPSSKTFYPASHSVYSSTNDQQQQQWRHMFSAYGEREGVTDLSGQAEQHTHVMVTSSELSKLPPIDQLYSHSDTCQEANFAHGVMPEQDATLKLDNEGSTNRNITHMSRKDRREDFIDDKNSSEEGKGRVVSSTIPAYSTQAVGSYTSYASDSAEHYNVVGGPRASQGSFASYEPGVSKDYKADGSLICQTAGSYAGYRAVGSTTSQSAGSYARYIVSGSAEAEKVVGSMAAASSKQDGAGSGLYGSEKKDDIEYKVQQGDGGFLNMDLLQLLQDDQDNNASSFTNIYKGTLHESCNLNIGNSCSAQNDAAVHHMHAERDRRRKQGHCIDILRTLVPNITKKHPKVAILESTIHYLKDLKGQIGKLEQENFALRGLKLKEQQREFTEESSKCVSNQNETANVKSSTKNISLKDNAACHYIYSSGVQDKPPHFQFNLAKNVEDVDTNATIIEILQSLQKKDLCCYEIYYEFCKNKLSIDILANYQDGGSPSLDEIQGIKEWWEHLIKD